MEEEKNGISIGDIFRVILSQKWLALILVIVITVAGAFTLKYGYGARDKEYTGTFSIKVAVDETDGMLVYPNGDKHNYSDFVSVDSLNAVKASSEEFKDVDVGALCGNISVSQEIANTNTEALIYTYTVRTSSKYFPSQDVAEKFLKKVADAPARHMHEWAESLSVNTQKGFDETHGNENKIAYLLERLNEISGFLDGLGNSKASETKIELNKLVDLAEDYKVELYEKHYESDEKALQNYETLITKLTRELEPLEEANKVGKLDGELLVKYYELKQQIAHYESYAKYDGTKEDCTAFENKLTALCESVKNLTDEKVAKHYEGISYIAYDGAFLNVSGGRGWLFSLVVSFVIAVILAAVVAYIVGWLKLKKKKAATAETEVAEEAEAPNEVKEETKE